MGKTEKKLLYESIPEYCFFLNRVLADYCSVWYKYGEQSGINWGMNVPISGDILIRVTHYGTNNKPKVPAGFFLFFLFFLLHFFGPYFCVAVALPNIQRRDCSIDKK